MVFIERRNLPKVSHREKSHWVERDLFLTIVLRFWLRIRCPSNVFMFISSRSLNWLLQIWAYLVGSPWNLTKIIQNHNFLSSNQYAWRLGAHRSCRLVYRKEGGLSCWKLGWGVPYLDAYIYNAIDSISLQIFLEWSLITENVLVLKLVIACGPHVLRFFSPWLPLRSLVRWAVCFALML